ncbi:hypothetical protein DFH09DRAFT_906229 [Mycena vulgaris]|nr:hypothetical protein DFH09DRAFT_906229 [Mycena vulgaris]
MFYASSPSAQAYAALTNWTVDDTNSTFWSWGDLWNAVTPSAPCSGCLIQPDPSQVYKHTWHDGSTLGDSRRVGSFSFQGSAVYIYGIDSTNPANISFSMDDASVTGFHSYSGVGYVYKSLFFTAAGLESDAQHKITWIVEESSIGGTLALFDYAVVTTGQADVASGVEHTTNSPATTPSSAASTISSSIASANSQISASGTSAGATSSHKPKTIIGAVAGATGGLAVLGALFIYLRRRRGNTFLPSRMAVPNSHSIEPYQLIAGHSATEIALGPSKGIIPTSLTVAQVPSTRLEMPAVSLPGPWLVTVADMDLYGLMIHLAFMALARDLQRPDTGDLEERLRHLEHLVVSSQPPAYH